MYDEFCTIFNLSSLIKEHTCFKSVTNPSCIDLILTNRPNNIQNSSVIETGLSDFHKLAVTVLKTSFWKKPPKVLQYRNYRQFSHTEFRTELSCILNGIDLYNIPNDNFVTCFIDILNKHAPIKQNHIRENDNHFVTKELRKEHMLRSRLRNKFCKGKDKGKGKKVKR